jgi:hypothetical protein
MARPMPRSRAIRVLGMAVASAAVPGFRSRPAAAGYASPFFTSCHKLKCPQGSDTRSTLPCKCNEKPIIGVGGETTMCNFRCCDPVREECVCLPDGAACGRKKCPEPCGGDKCCEDDEFCAHAPSQLCCKKGEEVCGNRDCCKPNEECVSAGPPRNTLSFCVPRCPQGRARCGPEKCCPPNWRCADPARALCKRCKPNEEECGNKCCDRRTSRCCGKAGCCPKNHSCCVTGTTQKCCPPRQKCAVPILAGDIGIKAGTPAICCPPERYHTSPNLCCPRGQLALRGPGLRVGPGLNPFCCPRGQTCGSGANITCCQKGLTGTETCCGGKCVDLQSDPRNCGTCGNVCGSGVCAKGICALP